MKSVLFATLAAPGAVAVLAGPNVGGSLPVLPAVAPAKCNADNCARAVTGTNPRINTVSNYNDCLSFQACTVTPSPSTVTVMVTVPNLPASLPTLPSPGRVTNCNSAVPTYASACSGTVRYSSACSCYGVTQYNARTVPTPTLTSTIYQTLAPQPQLQLFWLKVVSGNAANQFLQPASGAIGAVPGSQLTYQNSYSLFALDASGYLLSRGGADKAWYSIQSTSRESYITSSQQDKQLQCAIAQDSTLNCANSDGFNTFRICDGYLYVTVGSDPNHGSNGNSACYGSGATKLQVVPEGED